MKEMIYSLGRSMPEVLDSGAYKGVKYYIVNRNTHPCAYVCANERWKEVVDSICHGGCTYSGSGIPRVDGTDSWHWLGWDYGHFSDYVPFIDYEGCKKWTTAEILEEVKQVIDKLFEKSKEEINDYLDKINRKANIGQVM